MRHVTTLFPVLFLFASTFPHLAVASEPAASTNLPRASFRTELGSPDGRVKVELSLDVAGSPHYAVTLDGKPALAESRLGLIREDADLSTGLILLSASTVEPVADRYELLTAKRRLNAYRANRQVLHFTAKSGAKLDVVFQISNDGVAFRYVFPEVSTGTHVIREEMTSYRFLPETRAWLQPMQVAKTGYGDSNPAYEEFYEKEIPVGTPSPLKAGWVYPALFRSGDAWLVVTEAALPAGWCATRLRHESPGGEYSIGFPDPRETMNGEPVNPAVRLPSASPWRLLAIGDLKTVAESTLGTDLADKPKALLDRSILQPGKAAWSWPLLGDSSANFNTQREFIDYAADMGWRYCLVDAWWDGQIGYEKMKELADYARTKKVRMLLWYNSAGDWNTVKQTPRDKLVTHDNRVREFARLKAMGIAGLKIDFFGGDGRAVIDYYRDLLEDAAAYGLLMNFHGTTLPRGLQRTYPNMMTAEAIRGEEYITFEQKTADEEPSHAAMLPFTRNLFDPMDFTPVVLDRLPNGRQRRTTSAFELALAVVFTSGIQHYAETPAGMSKMPDFVRDFMRRVPSIWEDTKFLAGYPGKLAVFARKGDGHWYVAGINGESTEKKVKLDLGFLPVGASGVLITDGAGGAFERQIVRPEPSKVLEVTLQANGGFVLTF